MEPMSEQPQRARNGSCPPLIWGLAGLVVIALFALALALLHPPAF